MRVQVSARLGTMTPNSIEPKRVRVAASRCRWFLISWSIEMPRAQPAGVSLPPWTLPGNSSTPVSRQPMPRPRASPAAHVGVAVAADAVADAVQRQQAVLERLEGAETFLECHVGEVAGGVRPEGRRHDAVGAEHDDEPLLAPLLVGEGEAGQVADEWQ